MNGWAIFAGIMTVTAVGAIWQLWRAMDIIDVACDYCEKLSRLLVEADKELLEAKGDGDINKRIRWCLDEQVRLTFLRIYGRR